MRLVLALFAACGVLTALPVATHAQAGDADPPVSLERIRARLSEPPSILSLPPGAAEEPTFRVEVRQPLWGVRPVEDEPFDPTLGLPSIGELLMGGIQKIQAGAASYTRRRAERRARREVDDALAAFCAVHACKELQIAR